MTCGRAAQPPPSLLRIGGHEGRADKLGGIPQGVIGQVRITSSGGDLRVAEQRADHRQRQPGADQYRGVGVPQVMQTRVGQPGRQGPALGLGGSLTFGVGWQPGRHQPRDAPTGRPRRLLRSLGPQALNQLAGRRLGLTGPRQTPSPWP